MPSTGLNIWPTQHPSSKPPILQSFNPSEILTSVPYRYPSKYQIFYHCSLIIFHITLFMGVISHTTNYNESKHKTSKYTIFFKYSLLIFYVINIPKRGSNCTYYLVTVRLASVTSIPNSGSVLYSISSVISNLKLKIDNQK